MVGQRSCWLYCPACAHWRLAGCLRLFKAVSRTYFEHKKSISVNLARAMINGWPSWIHLSCDAQRRNRPRRSLRLIWYGFSPTSRFQPFSQANTTVDHIGVLLWVSLSQISFSQIWVTPNSQAVKGVTTSHEEIIDLLGRPLRSLISDLLRAGEGCEDADVQNLMASSYLICACLYHGHLHSRSKAACPHITGCLCAWEKMSQRSRNGAIPVPIDVLEMWSKQQRTRD